MILRLVSYDYNKLGYKNEQYRIKGSGYIICWHCNNSWLYGFVLSKVSLHTQFSIIYTQYMCIMYTIIIIINNCSLYCEIIFCSVLHLHFYHQYIWVWWVMIIYNLLVLFLWIEIKIDLILLFVDCSWVKYTNKYFVSKTFSKINTSYIMSQYFYCLFIGLC